MPRLRNANVCRCAADRAVEWLKSAVRRTGHEDLANPAYPLEVYHKVSYLLAITGHVEECQQLLAGIKANLLTADGDLLSSPTAEDKAPQPVRIRDGAWVVLAAQLSGRVDIALPAAERMARCQGRTTGGVYDGQGDDKAAPSADVRTTACAGSGFLACGMFREARAAGLFLVRAMEAQSDAKRFHLRLDTQGRPVRKFPKEKALSHVLGKGRGRADFGYLAAPIVFLGRLHLATGDAEWLETALDYFALAEEFGDAIWSGAGSSILGWGAAMLYRITRRRRYYDAAERFAQARIDTQRKDGTWRKKAASADEASVLSLTAENAVGLLEALREAQ